MSRMLVFALAVMIGSFYLVRTIDQDGGTPARGDVVRQRLQKSADTRQNPQKSADTRVVVIRPENGHFATDGRVDGHAVAFMVDTGATYIAIRASDAGDLGYSPRDHEYTVRINTANGVGLAAPIELSMVEVGEIMVRDVPALVVPDAALSVNLLGMSFLSRVRWTHEGGQLVLEQ